MSTLRWCKSLKAAYPRVLGDRILLNRGAASVVVSAADGAIVQELPGNVSAHHADGRAVVALPGTHDGDVYRWRLDLYDGRARVREVADNTPDRNLSAVAITGDTVWCFENDRKAGDGVVALDGATARRRWPIPAGVTSGQLLVTPDGARVVHVNLWGKGGVLDPATGAWTPLQGGDLDIGRDLDEGIGATLSADGSVVLGVGRRGKYAHAWRVADGASLPAPWRDAPHDAAFLLGNTVCVVRRADGKTIVTDGTRAATANGKATVVAVDARRIALVEPPGAIAIHDLVADTKVDEIAWPAKLKDRIHVRAGAGLIAASGGTGWVAVIDVDGVATPPPKPKPKPRRRPGT